MTLRGKKGLRFSGVKVAACALTWIMVLGVVLATSMSVAAAKVEKKNYAMIETVKGEPDRPYERKGLVWVMNRKPDKAIKKIKKEAAKLGADAIIHYNVEAPVVFGWAISWKEPGEVADSQIFQGFPISFGQPDKAYTEIAPVWNSHAKINKALKKLIKLAKKKDADAIIDFRIGSYRGTAHYVDASGNFMTTNYTIPTLQGTAVKWNE
jgi:uncharacterized protein YbjQ (UPF0145 family)